jgi:FecR protein
MKNSVWPIALGISLAILLMWTSGGQAQQQVNVRVDNWLALEQLVGNVLVTLNQRQQPAQRGDRLQNVGDSLVTQARSAARLAIDTGIGTVEVASNTQLQVRELTRNPADQSRITRLNVAYGRVKLRLRKFSSPNSRLEIHTPAGISGVRGTEFGVVVQPRGKTSVAVLDGGVNTNAQNVDVMVNQGFQNFTIPGEPPSEPVPLRDDPSLQYQFERRIEGGQRRLRLVGQVDPVNRVFVNGQPQDTDREGRFGIEVRLVSFPRVQVQVATPLGQEKLYDLAF